MSNESWSFETRQVHAGQTPDPALPSEAELRDLLDNPSRPRPAFKTGKSVMMNLPKQPAQRTPGADQ